MPKTRAEAPFADFASLGLADALVAAATALGYEEPTPIQREAIPILLGGRDVLGQAATGTGKTAAFALPMLQRITEEGVPRGRTNALILVPTRELAMQVAEAIHKYSRGLSLSVVPLYGGAAMDLQIRALKRGADVVVATPGRALDHLQRRTLKLDEVRVLVLDEADEMLDMGFAEDIEALLDATPPERQTALFAATMPPRIAAIAERHLRQPARVTIEREKVAAGTVPRVRQVAFLVTRAHKPLALGRVLDMESPTSAIVFCRTRLEVDGLVETLNAHGYRAEALHGGMVQKQRDRVMTQFRAAKTDLLVATDVAARGLDIAHLSHVVNYDVPSSPEVYVHRIGRTGRVGRAGVAITLAEPREHRQLRNIEAFTRQKIEITSVPTVADLRSRRLDVTRAALRERLLAGGFEDVRVVVESLAQEFDLVEIASAAVKMALVLEEGEAGRSEEEIPVVSLKSEAPRPEGRKGPHLRDAKGPRPTHDARKMAPGMPKAGGKTTRLYIAAGRQAGVRPADLVGAIAGEAGVGSHVIGSIEIGDRFSIVEVPTALATRILFALRATKIRGRKVTVNRNRGESA
ncbi:MAG TPA: DEAD/DEAH box helicase [Vicinamibacteria bacterium]|nr:DEAD/DEAH box helicase [Vicinamibacteria bacterium]